MENELEIAVSVNNLESVKALLSEGANANHRIQREANTLLHYTKNAEITKALLLGGADVDAVNGKGTTPLIYAIQKYKKIEVIQELLIHGAEVNFQNFSGNTALNILVRQKYENLNKIKLLLEYGADINKKNRERIRASSLGNAMEYLPRARLLIKYTLIKHFENDYTKAIDLSPYTYKNNYNQLIDFQNDCVGELVTMKSHEVGKGLSLYDILKNNFVIHRHHQLAMKLAKTDFSSCYPIYNDIILDKIKQGVERANLLETIFSLDIENRLKEISLNYDSIITIAQYLSNVDLKNFVKAFEKLDNAIESGKCIEDTVQTLDDDEASNKLEQ